MKRMTQVTLVVLVLLLFAGVVSAAPVSQEEEGQVYVVKPGDGLIKLARLYYEDVDAYKLIVDATNARAKTDSSFLPISDANIILVGQKLIIPALTATLANAAAGAASAAAGQVGAPAAAVPGGLGSVLPTVPLAGTRWILATMDGNAPVHGTTVTLDFIDDSSAAGSTGCNNFNTSYEISGIHISFGPTAGTLRACTDPIMVQEQSYLQVLADAAFYQVTDAGWLRLFNDKLTLLAEFEPASNELAGSSWDVINYNNGREAVVSVLLGTAITADFSEDGQISGNAGCNQYSGPFTTDGDAIAIGPLAATLRMCIEEGSMEQEAAYLAALETAATYQITGDTMVMRTAEGAMVANFVRAE